MFYVPLRFLYYNENLLGDIVFDKEAFGEKDETPLPAPSFGNPSYTPKPFTRESLQHYPVQRELEWIANEAEIQVMPRYGKLVMTYQRGELAQEECSHCKNGNGPMKNCVLIPEGGFSGSCINCWFHEHSRECSLLGKYPMIFTLFKI